MSQPIPLPSGIRSRVVHNVNGLAMHLLEAGFEPSGAASQRPCVLLPHGFPELAYSWRMVMLALAQAGNQPHRLAGISAAELARLPGYYVMERDKGMA